MMTRQVDDLREEQLLLHLFRPGYEQNDKRLSFGAWMAGEAIHSR